MALEYALEDTGPGLFPVALDSLQDSEGKVALCHCGYECQSGACCCSYAASELVCKHEQQGRASRDIQESSSPQESIPGSEEETCHWPLPALAQAAAMTWEAEFSAKAETRTHEVEEFVEADRESWAEEPAATKTCKRCKLALPLENFCRNKRARDGLYTQCRSCVAKKDKERHRKILASPVQSKKCASCRVDKAADDYYKDPHRSDGLQTYCKTCFSLKYKEARMKRKP